tara:strand:+ start:3387 stop:3947 length:561 start_codon:yes stop_codon:yes gene_type:complete
MDYLTNYYKNLAEQLQENVVILQKAINEAGRPTFIPMTVAYDDSGDAEPNVATRTDEEEEDLRVDRVDNFGGVYPNAEYARLDRSLDSYNDARIGTNAELYRHREQARRDAMDKIHRGRPLRDYKSYSPTAQKANKEFNQSYRYPEELMDRARGQKVMADISKTILRAHPDHEAFIKMYNERPKVD